MSAQHTPGPWVVDGEDVIERTGFLGGVYIAQNGNGRVAEAFCNCLVVEDEECRANARLIAAAPELLAALEDAESIFGPEEGEEHKAPHWAKRARAAIAKATGAAS